MNDNRQHVPIMSMREVMEAEEVSTDDLSTELLAALERLTGLIRDCHNVFQNHSASWLMQQASFKNAEAVIRKAKGI